MKKIRKFRKLKLVNKFKFIRFIICTILFFATICGSILMISNNTKNDEVKAINLNIEKINNNVEYDEIKNSANIVKNNANTIDETTINYSNKPNGLDVIYYNWMIEISEKENVPLEVILAIVTTENEAYNINATYKNSNGTVDMGLCQINSAYVTYFAETYDIHNLDPYNVYDSVTFVARHMKYLCTYGMENYNLNEIDGYIFAAGAYNRGLSNECKYRNMYDYKEKFLTNYEKFV